MAASNPMNVNTVRYRPMPELLIKYFYSTSDLFFFFKFLSIPFSCMLVFFTFFFSELGCCCCLGGVAPTTRI